MSVVFSHATPRKCPAPKSADLPHRRSAMEGGRQTRKAAQTSPTTARASKMMRGGASAQPQLSGEPNWPLTPKSAVLPFCHAARPRSHNEVMQLLVSTSGVFHVMTSTPAASCEPLSLRHITWRCEHLGRAAERQSRRAVAIHILALKRAVHPCNLQLLSNPSGGVLSRPTK